MKLSDFVIRDSIVVDLQATTKEEAIREMVGSLHKAGQLADSEVESVIRAILGREELGSTGIGMGVAVPRGSGRRAGQYLLSPGFSPEPARRPSQSPGEYFAPFERRAFRAFSAAGQHEAGRGRGARGSRSEFAVTGMPHGPGPDRSGPGLRGRVIPLGMFPAELAVGSRFPGPFRQVPSRATTMLLIISPSCRARARRL
jgi:Phosphoenolpyruvate-dependent sugar phosphotransferase system, EIIA 2